MRGTTPCSRTEVPGRSLSVPEHQERAAATLGLSRGYVDVLLHRAKASLRVCMTEGDERGSS